VAKQRYSAAYQAYQARARHVAQILQSGGTPSADDIRSEAEATERLAVARRALLDAMEEQWRPQ
jgi:hypothetical protein